MISGNFQFVVQLLFLIWRDKNLIENCYSEFIKLLTPSYRMLMCKSKTYQRERFKLLSQRIYISKISIQNFNKDFWPIYTKVFWILIIVFNQDHHPRIIFKMQKMFPGTFLAIMITHIGCSLLKKFETCIYDPVFLFLVQLR